MQEKSTKRFLLVLISCIILAGLYAWNTFNVPKYKVEDYVILHKVPKEGCYNKGIIKDIKRSVIWRPIYSLKIPCKEKDIYSGFMNLRVIEIDALDIDIKRKMSDDEAAGFLLELVKIYNEINERMKHKNQQ